MKNKQRKIKYHGIFETESLKDPRLANLFNVKKVQVEYHPESKDSKYWHVFKVEIEKIKSQFLIKKISKNLKSGWFAIFWNNQEIIVIFYQKIFEIPRKNYTKTTQYKKMREYGLAHGVQNKYLSLKKEFTK